MQGVGTSTRIGSVVLIGSAAVLMVTPVMAQEERVFQPDSGQWNVADNWDPSGVPTDQDLAIIEDSDTANIGITNAVADGVEVGIGGTTGTLNIQSGGGLTSDANDSGFRSLAVGEDGDDSEGVGTLNVNGGTFTGEAVNTIGFGGGEANMTVSNGGTVNTNGLVEAAIQDGSTAQIDVTGATWNHTSDDFVLGDGFGPGGAQSEATMALVDSTLDQQGGETWVGNNGSDGTLSLDNSTVNVNDFFFVGRQEDTTGTLTMTNGSSLVKTGDAHVAIGDGFVDQATGNLNMTDSSMDVQSGELWIGQNPDGEGTATLDNATITASNTVFVGRQGATGELTLSNGSSVETSGEGDFIVGTLAGDDSDPGEGTATVDDESSINVLDGGSLVVGGEGTPGTLNVNGAATVSASGPLQLGVDGGSGTLSVVGDSSTINVEGDYSQSASSALEVELAADGGLSVIDVLQSATLADGSSLSFDLGSFTLGDDEVIVKDVLTADDVTDNGLTLNAPEGFFHRVVSGGNGEILQVTNIPEPTTLTLLSLGGLACLRRRQRR